MAEYGYVFYYFTHENGTKSVELLQINLETANISNSRTVITISNLDGYLFEVRGAAYNASNQTLYTLIKYTGGFNSTDYYRLAKTINFSPTETTSITLDSSDYLDMNSDDFSSEKLRNLTIDADGNLYCASITGNIYPINISNGALSSNIFGSIYNVTGTVAWDIDDKFYGVYNISSKIYFNNYVLNSNTNTLITHSSSPVTSVANNYSDGFFYYYNELTELWRTDGTSAYTTNITPNNLYTLNGQTGKTIFNPVLFLLHAACIHSSSKVLLSDGSYKLITNVTSGDQVYSPDCKTAIVKEVVPCWLKVPNNPFHKCVVFEKDSLAPNVPSELFIIDPGHPMSFATNYDNHGLRSAKEYVNGKTIYMSDYNDVKEMFPEDMKHNRYDLVLNRGDTYVANNVIVKSRTSFKTAGYDLEVD